MNFSGIPWYGQIILAVVLVVLFVYLFREVIMPLLGLVT